MEESSGEFFFVLPFPMKPSLSPRYANEELSCRRLVKPCL